MAVRLKCLVAESRLRDARKSFVSIHGVFSVEALAEYAAHDCQAVLLTPALQNVRGVIYICPREKCLVRLTSVGIPMVKLVAHPIGIHVPEHPLRRHLVYAAAPDSGQVAGLGFIAGSRRVALRTVRLLGLTLSRLQTVQRDWGDAKRSPHVNARLRLKRMSKLVCHAVQSLVFQTVRSGPKRADYTVIVTAVGRTLKRVVNHHHHPVALGVRPAADESQSVAVEGVESLQPRFQVLEIHAHIPPLQGRRVAQTLAEALLPEYSEVGSEHHPLVTPLRLRILQIHAPQILRHINLLALKALCIRAQRDAAPQT